VVDADLEALASWSQRPAVVHDTAGRHETLTRSLQGVRGLSRPAGTGSTCLL
jgi:hypothetical protein